MQMQCRVMNAVQRGVESHSFLPVRYRHSATMTVKCQKSHLRRNIKYGYGTF